MMEVMCSLLIQMVLNYGEKKWSEIAKHLNGRVGKQCRERWHNHLRPNIKVSSSSSSLHECRYKMVHFSIYAFIALFF